MTLSIMQYKYYNNITFLQHWTELLTKLESLDFNDKDMYIQKYKQELEQIKRVPFVEWKGTKYEVRHLREILIEIIKVCGYKDEIECCKKWFDKIKPYYGTAAGIPVNWMYDIKIEKEVFTNYYNSQYNRFVDVEHKDKLYMSDIEFISFVCLDASKCDGFIHIEI